MQYICIDKTGRPLRKTKSPVRCLVDETDLFHEKQFKSIMPVPGSTGLYAIVSLPDEFIRKTGNQFRMFFFTQRIFVLQCDITFFIGKL